METCDDNVKRREIALKRRKAGGDPAPRAEDALAGLPGILRIEPLSPTRLRIEYDLTQITLHQIELALAGAGLPLSGHLLQRLLRALCHYAEETQRDNALDGAPGPDSTRKVFIERYGRLNHGCRDPHPAIWRHYR